MQSYSPTVSDRSGEFRAAGIVGAAETSANAQKQMGQDIGSALSAIGGMYGKFKDKKDMLAGMDGSVSAMSDMGAVTADFRDKYMSAPDHVRPFLFYDVASPMLKSWSAGQTAGFTAKAWDKYKSKWGADAAAGNKYGYSYPGP
jgi:hypothetical protein